MKTPSSFALIALTGIFVTFGRKLWPTNIETRALRGRAIRAVCVAALFVAAAQMSPVMADTTGSTGGNAQLENRQPTLGIQYIIAINGLFPTVGPGDPTGTVPPDRTDTMMGEIKAVAFGTPVPAGWAACQGQIIPIQQFSALFSIIGTTYGGNGQTTFALPDLRGRVPVGAGQGVGDYVLGQTIQSIPVLNEAKLPSHTHTFPGGTTNATGNGAAFDNRQSGLALNFLIAADGEIMIWSAGFTPLGWSRCDGRLLSISGHSYLYSFIGNTYGGTAPNFALPDTRGRIVLGDDGALWPLGLKTGANDVFLSVADMPSHTHTIPSGATGATGGAGNSANNYQPSLVMRWMVSPFGTMPHPDHFPDFPMIGEIRLIAGATSGGLPPGQWLLLDGSLYDNSAYPDLRTVIGTSFGGSASNFNVPDLRGTAGGGGGSNFTETIPFAARVGSPTLSISIGQMWAHTHAFFPSNSLTVTKAVDTNDGVCDADCSLREAVAVAGVDGVLDTIVFNITANSPGCVGTDCTIILSSSLTSAADAGRVTTIDGTTGPNTITLSGNNATQLLNLSGGANLSAINLNFTGGNGSAVQLDNGGTLTLTNCALFGNIANSGGAFFLNTGSVLNLTNVTISNNSTTSFGSGGGIWNAGGAVTAINTTIANNTARNHGGVATFNGGTFTARNTIIAANTAIVNPDAFGSFTSLGNNIMGNPTGNNGFTNGSNGDQVGTAGVPLDPRVIPLGFYGGKTLTQGLVNSGTASTAINAGSSSGAPASDERGASRIGAVDIGAFEVNNTANSGTFVAALPVATINTSYSARITANNGAFSYAVTTGTLPNGVTLNTNAGVVAVSGTPTQSGTFSFTITAASGANSSATNYTMTVSDAPSPTPTATNTASPTATATATPTAPAVITGTVTYGNAVSGPTPPRFVSNVLVSGVGSANVSTTTAGPGATAGQYTLTGFGAGDYTVTPTKTGGQNGGITSFDAAKIAQHVAGTSLLTGSQLLVADVSNNGTISSFDAGEIANYVVTALPAGITGNWKFSPVSRSYASVTGSITGEDYSALLMGEVSGNWNNTGGRPVSSRQLAAAGDGVTDSSRGPERSTVVTAPSVSTRAEGEVIIPVGVEGLDDKGIIAYEFDLRYDPAVIQPQSDPVGVTGTLSSKLLVAVGADEPGLLRVAVYGPVPIDGSGVLLNLRFVAIGSPGLVSPLTWERFLLNEEEPIATDGQVELSAAGPTQAEIRGRLLTSMGQGVASARVLLTDTTGQSRSILSNGFGIYRFGGLQLGQTYRITVESKRFRFTPLAVSVTDQLASLDMIAEP